MNIDYKKGNVIASQTSFNNYRFPAQLPTEEWAGDEVRSYFNYLRPVANLFENDRENLSFSKEIVDSLIYKANKNALVDGCKITKTTKGGSVYYEAGEGIFLNEGRVYHLFPECEATAKQIKKEYINEIGFDIDIKIWYDEVNKVYHYNYITEDGTCSGEGTKASAADLIYTLLDSIKVQKEGEEFSLLELGYTVEEHIILPIFKLSENAEIYFDDNAVLAGISESVTRTTLGNIVDGSVNYDNVVQFTIDGKYIQNETAYIIIGSTRYNLRDVIADINGVNYINDVNLYADTNKFKVEDRSGHSVTVKANYTLGPICEGDFSTSITLDEDNKFPTSYAIRSYVENKVNDQTRTKKINFASGVAVSAGGASINGDLSLTGDASITGNIATNSKLRVKSSAPASRTSDVLSMDASISTDGGIEAKGDILANGSIVGTNNGIYSLRKFKENITEFNENAVELINGIDIVNFNYISDPEKNHKIGFIADDTHEYFATKNHNIMDEGNCIGLLLKAVQELAAENSRLKEELNGIKQKINA